ncbi:MAG TPA: ATP-binding protein, partial [Blastocatellia bacterium]|nr:ATP-binding protein [Blastocatellia bacterium]
MKQSQQQAQISLGRLTKADLIERLRGLESSTAKQLHRSDQLRHALHELEVHQVELEMQNRELRDAQQLIEESRNRYAELYDFAPIGYVTLDKTGCIREINLTATILLAAARSGLLGRPFINFVTESSKPSLLDYLAEIERTGRQASIELELQSSSGGTIPVEMVTSSFRNPMTGESSFRAAITDISERRQAAQALHESEERLRQSQKMEAIGVLAGGIAHDFNNLLTAIIGYAQLAALQVDKGTLPKEELQQVSAAADRARAITAKLLTFSRRQVIAPRIVDLNEVLRNLQDMLKRLIGENIDLQTSLDPAGWLVCADPGQIEQIMLNLVVNARDAMPNGGTLTFTTRNLDLSDKDAAARYEAPPGCYLQLLVTDTGSGMDPDTLSHIFEPFFTTKGVGIGTGLGLSTVHGIVCQMGGHISVESAPDKGATFGIILPRADSVKTKQENDDSNHSDRGTETILLVEDEPLVRDLAVAVLRDQGYTVLEASDGREALAIAANLGSKSIDLLVTDVIMPKM